MLNYPIPAGEDGSVLTDKKYSIDSEVMREIGNIGMGHAATSLAQMLNSKIGVIRPETYVVPKGELAAKILANPATEKPHICYRLRLQGNARGNIIHLLGTKFSLDAINFFFGAGLDSLSQVDDMTRSVIQEITNISSGAYCNAIASMTGDFIDISTPNFCSETVDSIINVSTDYNKRHILVIDSGFKKLDEEGSTSRFLFIPDDDTAFTIYDRAKSFLKKRSSHGK